MSAEQLLLVTTGVHLGFQAVVTIVVYPGLVNLAPEDWERGHAAHTHRMIIIVIPVYAALTIALGWALATVSFSPALIVTTGALLIVWVTTALVAAPIHHRLSTGGPTQKLIRNLRRADTFRLIGAAVACGAAILV
jgi:ATP/ADP translocase